MEKKDIIDFFDERAENWDNTLEDKSEIIEKILDNAGIDENSCVLDVACGTGVMIPYYLAKKVKTVTGIDISAKMIEVAKSKFDKEVENGADIEFIIGDVYDLDERKKFNRIMIYNAFPHFPEPEKLIKKLTNMLEDGGTLTIAHGSSRKEIDEHHKNHASNVSNGLVTTKQLIKMFPENMEITTEISSKKMYQVVAKKN